MYYLEFHYGTRCVENVHLLLMRLMVRDQERLYAIQELSPAPQRYMKEAGYENGAIYRKCYNRIKIV